MRSTPLSTILNRMNRYTSISVVDDAFKVRDLDEAIRSLRRLLPFPWTLQKSSLRVFDKVFEYPVATDHDEIAYLDDSRQQMYPQTARFRYTSLQQFYEDPDNRNQIAEIFDGGTRYLGINYKSTRATSQVLNTAETVTDWTASGTASSPTLDQVTYKEGNGSIQFTVTAGTATMTSTLTSFSDTEYKKKYYFIWVYLDVVPTSITLSFGNDASNYLSATVTTQFSGQAFKADQWNLVAMDLNTATETGTLDETAFDYQSITLTGATAGTYYVDTSYLKSWDLLDYWYYSIYNIKTLSSSTADQEYFYNSSDVYSSDSEIIGDSEWADCIMYDAIVSELIDQKDSESFRKEAKDKRDIAWGLLQKKYPSLEPVIITTATRYQDDFLTPDYVR